MSNYSWSRSSRSGNGKWAAFTVIMIIIAVLMTVWRPIDKVSGNRTIEGTVTEKTVKRDGSEDKYIVFIQEIPGGG